MSKKITDAERQDLLRRVGNLKQLCGVEKRVINEGKGDGLKVFEVHTMAGLKFDVIESRCLDVYNVSYKGINIPFMSKPGLVSASHTDFKGLNFLRSVGGGMIYTCGFSTVGAACSDENGEHPFHGRLRFIPAENASCYCDWEDGTYKIGISGKMRDAALFKDNLMLERNITTDMCSKTIHVVDVVENQGFEEQPLMIMYHVNTGYPILDKGSKLYIASSKIKPMSEASEKNVDKWMEITEPVDGKEENVFVHDVYDNDGKSLACIYNENLKLGVLVEFCTDEFCHILEWKSMGSGDYVLGLQPTNCFAAGKDYELENGDLKTIKPFEKKKFEFSVTILDGDEEYEEFKKNFNKLK